MAATQSERIAKVRSHRWIRYSRAEQIVGQLEELLLLPRVHRMSNLLIAGDTNNGKTSLVMRFVERHKPRLDIDEIHHVLAGPMLKQRSFLNVLKYLGNELRIWSCPGLVEG